MYSSIWFAILLIAGATAVTIGGLFLVRRLVNKEYLQRHYDIAAPMMSVVGTLFSILLGFLVAGSMGLYQEAHQKTDQEANYLADIFREARGLPQPMRTAIRKSCRSYCDTVLNEEWPAMQKHETSPEAWRLYQTIWDQVLAVRTADGRETNIHACMLSAVQGLGECRRGRVAQLTKPLSPVLTAVVVLGSMLMISCTYFFVAEGIVVQGLMTSLMTVSLGLNMFLISIFSQPFSGDLRVPPRAFELNQTLFVQQDDSPPLSELFPAPDTTGQAPPPVPPSRSE